MRTIIQGQVFQVWRLRLQLCRSSSTKEWEREELIMFHGHRAIRTNWGAIGVLCMALSLFWVSGAMAEKLFWGDGGQVGVLGWDDIPVHHGKICFIDTDSDTPTAVNTFAVEADFLVEKGRYKRLSIPTATVYASGAMANLKMRYFLYMKGGRLFSVDTSASPPVPKALSTQTGFTPDNICEIRSFVDWKAPVQSTVFYVLKGQNGTCWDEDDVNGAVRLNMGPTSAPVDLTHKYLGGILFDGRYVVSDFSTQPGRFQACEKGTTTLGACTDIAGIQGDANLLFYDTNLLIGRLDSNLGYYNYRSPASGLLYAADPGTEQLADAKIDKDGATVYFSVVGRVPTLSLYTNRIMKVTVPASGQQAAPATVLATFKTKKQMDWVDFSVTSGYIVYSVPNATNDGALVYSVKKTSTTPDLPGTKLAGSSVNGGVVGSYFFFEDSQGAVNRINVNGFRSTLTTVQDAQLVGATHGGLGDWLYGFNTTPAGTAAFRGIISLRGQLTAVTYSGDLARGTVLGDMPVNLSNPNAFQAGYEMLGTAERRNTEFSQGRDVFYMNPLTADSFVRLTNNNGGKGVPEPDFQP